LQTTIAEIAGPFVPSVLTIIIARLGIVSPERAEGPIDIRKYHLAPDDRIVVMVFRQARFIRRFFRK